MSPAAVLARIDGPRVTADTTDADTISSGRHAAHISSMLSPSTPWTIRTRSPPR